MKRYADELAAALKIVAPPEYQIQSLACGGGVEKNASRVARFVTYPRLIKATPGDVYHTLDHSHANLTLASPPSKSVITCHDIIPLLAAKGILQMPTGRFTKYTFPLRLACMRRCKYVITISESSKRDLIAHGGIPEERIRVVYYGVNPKFSPEPPPGITLPDERAELLARHNLPANTKIVLHVGTATRYKNTPAILQAIKGLRETPGIGENIYLIRIGAPFFEDEDALIQTLRIGDRIVHAGKIFDDMLLGSYYRQADVFAFPSLHEGFGWPPLEAMASGTPVVTSNVASLPEVVGDAGITVAPTDHLGLTNALRRVLSEESVRKEMGARCHARSRRFTWEQCGRETLAVYESMLN
jgi:glycosyltransferase involved in cell wall biosynthesis